MASPRSRLTYKTSRERRIFREELLDQRSGASVRADAAAASAARRVAR